MCHRTENQRFFLALIFSALMVSSAMAIYRPLVFCMKAPSKPVYHHCALDSLFVYMNSIGKGLAIVPKGAMEAANQQYPIAASDLIEVAALNKLSLAAIQVDLNTLERWNRPAILYVDNGHFIVFLGISGGQLSFYDNAKGFFECNQNWFRSKYRWEGIALVEAPILTQTFALGMTTAAGMAYLLYLFLWPVGKSLCSVITGSKRRQRCEPLSSVPASR
jgi:hypothetical protein